MKMIKLALLAGSAVAIYTAAAHADDLEALKAQIETLNARVAAMETAPAVPAGYQLIAISEGERVNTPGLIWMGRELAAYGNKATYISVLPTADAPAGATITWSGYARAGVVHSNRKYEWTVVYKSLNFGDWRKVGTQTYNGNFDNGDTDIKARGQIRVTASTDTDVGEVGVDIRLRGNFEGNNGAGNNNTRSDLYVGGEGIYSDIAWGYWSITPALTVGGGYAGSLGNIGYGLDGACTCYYTNTSDVNFDPGDTTQLRLSYNLGGFSVAAALEDSSLRPSGLLIDDAVRPDRGHVITNEWFSGDNLGVSGAVTYVGDSVSSEIAGVWRDLDDIFDINSLWQVGVGLGFSLGDVASLSFAAALGEGPAEHVYEGEIVDGLLVDTTWWGVSGLASANLNDTIHAEVAAGYKSREFNDYWGNYYVSINDTKEDQWTILGGIYYDPVEQLTVGVEGEWTSTSASYTYINYDWSGPKYREDVDVDTQSFTVDLVSVWRF